MRIWLYYAALALSHHLLCGHLSERSERLESVRILKNYNRGISNVGYVQFSTPNEPETQRLLENVVPDHAPRLALWLGGRTMRPEGMAKQVIKAIADISQSDSALRAELTAAAPRIIDTLVRHEQLKQDTVNAFAALLSQSAA